MAQSQSQHTKTTTAKSEDDRLETIRSILLRDDREQLSGQVTAAQDEIVALRDEIAALKAELSALEQRKIGSADIVETVQAEMTQITNSAVQKERTEMSEAIGPMIAAATKVQIREASQEMKDALSPILLPTIQQSVQEAMRDFQRNLDAQMLQRAQGNNFIRQLYFGSKGTSEGEMAMREALPYEINEIFLIQKGSGLLLAHYSLSAETSDSDLISAMLTAIRDFVGDAFSADGKSAELNEIQYGDQQIITKSSERMYAACVIEGIVPAGLSSQLQLLVSSLDSEHHEALDAYEGDAETLPPFEAMLGDFSAETAANHEAEEIPTNLNKIIKGGAGCLSLVVLLSFCAWGWFFIRLFPVAWAGTIPADIAPTVVMQQQEAIQSVPVTMLAEAWLAAAPNETSEKIVRVPKGTTLNLVAVYNDWHQVEWHDGTSLKTGWILSVGVSKPDMIPNAIITPVVNIKE